MSFQEPPSLPDYSKLTFELNTSGVQKWNPDLYNILKNLIAAVQQSQATLVNTTIPNAASLIVDPNGAILGDGTATNPLRASVDTTTISIVGDQLVATATPVMFELSGATPLFNGVGALTLNPHTVFGTIAGIAGKVIVPISLYVTSNQNDAGHNDAIWGATTGCEVLYTALPQIVMTSSANLFFNIVGTTVKSSIDLMANVLFQGALFAAYEGLTVDIRTNNVAIVNSTAGKFISNSGRFRLLYALL